MRQKGFKLNACIVYLVFRATNGIGLREESNILLVFKAALLDSVEFP